MEASLDLDDELEFWKIQLEEDGMRKDIMPPPLPPLAGETQIIGISLKDMLIKLAKEIPTCDLVFQTWFRYGGFFSHVQVYVPHLIVSGNFREEFCSSGVEFRTTEEAEEKGAENMIRALERSCKFEAKDLNWEDKRRFPVNNYHCWVGWRRGEEENQVLKMKVEEPRKGWRSTLEGVERWSDHIRSVGVASPEDAMPFVLNDGIAQFEKAGEKY